MTEISKAFAGINLLEEIKQLRFRLKKPSCRFNRALMYLVNIHFLFLALAR
ncbi:MAG: hypothetical protein HYW49_13005 [Deltaproteobacteria bacterium]|nr:hypothetical protein [Deltaproteobacteria bacterium]